MCADDPRDLLAATETIFIENVRQFVRLQSSNDQGKLIAFFHLIDQQVTAEIDLSVGPDEALVLTVKAVGIAEDE